MAESKDRTTIGMSLDRKQAKRIKRQANKEHRSVSSLLKSIVLPEIERREREREEEPVPA